MKQLHLQKKLKIMGWLPYKIAQNTYKWADELVNMQDEIADIIMKKSVKDIKMRRKLFVQLTSFVTIEEALHMRRESMMGDSFPGGTKSKLAIIQRAPLGVVLAIAPFNYQ